jgi:uracil-DNA glycosylase family 4
MILGDAVTYNEDQTAQMFGGAVGKWLYRELMNVGIDMAKCYLTKAIKCYIPTKPTKSIIKSCRQLLIEEVDRVKPKYILALGATSLDVMIGKSTLSKYRGNAFEWHGAQVIPTYHPAVVIRQPGNAWEFRSDLNYFSRMCEGKWEPPSDFKWCIVDTEAKLFDMIKDIQNSNVASYDIETTSLKDYKNGKLLMIGIATPNMCYCMPLETPFNKLFHVNQKQILNDMFTQKGLIRVAQNAKFDNRWLRSRDIEPRVDFDTYIASYLLNVNTPHGLKYMAKTYLGAADYNDGIEFKENLTQAEFEAMAKYCCLDCYYTLKLHPILLEAMKGGQSVII